MKISYNWLKEYLDLPVDADGLGEGLLQLGFEVEGVERRGPQFSGVVGAKILEIVKHPNADRLSLCTVDDGTSKLPVVCGATNIEVGQIIPLARVGAILPGNRKIGQPKIRGVESFGMICSTAELGLPDNGAPDGILVLDPSTEIGADMSKKLGEKDGVITVDITPNRPDCLSHFGLARELAIFYKIGLKTKAEASPDESLKDCPPVDIEDPTACPRYMGRLLTGLKVGPSPAWLAAKLEAIGLRPINNIVDVTNYLLMDIGQPLHAFDADKLEGGRIIVRFAKKGEKIKALDEKTYSLTETCLVIADAKRPAAIAGVMGGLESAVTGKTTRAFLESANFAPPIVRKTSQFLKLRSDSSYRFERGCDIEAVAGGICL